MLESKILEFIFFWMEYLQKEDIGKYFKSLTDHQLACLKTAKTILDENIANPLHIKELSRKSGINDCDLKKGFRQLYGLPVRQYIIKSRLEHARTLITKTDVPIQEICEEMGYINRGHFAHLYQKYFGLTPLNDRRFFNGTRTNPSMILLVLPKKFPFRIIIAPVSIAILPIKNKNYTTFS
ncbi:MAG: AraC family transcriptional regulator [Segetibacter sp.]